MAGATGIEPVNAGIKIRCLTAWRRPNKLKKGSNKFNRLSALVHQLAEQQKLAKKIPAATARQL